METKRWKRPRFVELSFNAEIGGYYEEHDFPLFVELPAERRAPRRRAAEQPRG